MPNKFVDIINHAFGIKGFDYDKINEEIFIGTNMCCQYGFSKELLEKGVKADISLEGERIDSPKGVDYFLWLPTEDHQAPTQDKLKLGVQTLAFLINRKIKVYIHCKNGHGRTTVLFAAYLIRNGMSVEDALAYLKSKRPAVHLNEVQIAALETFKRSLARE